MQNGEHTKPIRKKGEKKIMDSPGETFEILEKIKENVSRVIKGKTRVIEMALTCLGAGGHLLVEDVPGVGKTTLARALARSMGGSFRRIQFTSDLMPSDIIGVSVFDREKREFLFKQGPIFANVVLADEINRATPRTQSSLLEAMNENQVSVDNETIRLPDPFFVIATQNPQEHFGTYPLPESQMDRFGLRIVMGYPDLDEESRLVAGQRAWKPLEELGAVTSPEDILRIQASVYDVEVDESLCAYMMRVVEETRVSDRLSLGVSTRGAKTWYQAARANALVMGRNYCLPDDFKETALPVLAHRVVLSAFQDTPARTRRESESVLNDILDKVAVPL